MQKLIFIYRTKAGLLSDLKGAIQKAVRGASECSLCTLTYGVATEKPSWTAFRKALSVPAEFYHCDTLPSRVRDFLAATSVELPVILADGEDGLHTAVTARQLDDCHRDEYCLIGLLQMYVNAQPSAHPAK